MLRFQGVSPFDLASPALILAENLFTLDTITEETPGVVLDSTTGALVYDPTKDPTPQIPGVEPSVPRVTIGERLDAIEALLRRQMAAPCIPMSELNVALHDKLCDPTPGSEAEESSCKSSEAPSDGTCDACEPRDAVVDPCDGYSSLSTQSCAPPSVVTSASGTWFEEPCAEQDAVDRFRQELAEACGRDGTMDRLVGEVASRASESLQEVFKAFQCTMKDMINVSVRTTCTAMELRDRSLEKSEQLQKEIVELREAKEALNTNLKVDTNAVVGGLSETVRRMLLLQYYWGKNGCEPTPYPIWVYQCDLPVPSQYLIQ